MAKHDPFRPTQRAASRRTTTPRGASRPNPTPPGRGPQRRAGATTSSWPSPADRTDPTPLSELVEWVRSAPTYQERNARIDRVRASERSRKQPDQLVLTTMDRLNAEPFPVVAAPASDEPVEPVGPLNPEPAAPLADDTPATADEVPAKATAIVAWLKAADSNEHRETRARAALEVESSRDTPRKVVQDAIVKVLGEDA